MLLGQANMNWRIRYVHVYWGILANKTHHVGSNIEQTLALHFIERKTKRSKYVYILGILANKTHQ
jgi:hypothetical protein